MRFYQLVMRAVMLFACVFALLIADSNAAAISSATLSLADAQTQALAHAPAVAEARARVSEAQADLRFARGTGGPSAVASYSQMPQAGLERLSSVEQKLTTVGAEIPISVFATRQPLVAAADADLRGAQLNEIDTERRERIKVIGLYIDAQRAHAVRVLRERIENDSSEDERVAEDRFHGHKGPHLDVWRTEVLHFHAEDALEIALDDERVAVAALAQEIGSEEASISLPALPFITPGVPRTPIGDALAIALAKRPEISAAQAEVDAETARARAAQRAGLPQLTAQLGYAYGVDTQLNVNGPAGTVTVALPLSAQPAAAATAAQARSETAKAKLAASQQAVTLDVKAALATLRSDVFRNEQFVADIALKAAGSVAESFRQGKASGNALVEARLEYNDAALEAIAGSAALDDAEDTWPLVLGEMPQ